MNNMNMSGKAGVEDDCIAVVENSTGPVLDLDCGEGENPDAGLDICVLTDSESNQFGEKTEKPSSYTLSLGELSDQVVTSATGDAAEKVNDKVEIEAYNPGADDGNGSFYVIVSDESDPSKAASDAFFAGTVEQGDNFTASGDFGSETYVHIFASQGGALVSSINFHTSCSSPLIIGDQYGSITLEGATLEGKDSGTFYTVGATETDGDAGVLYYITGGEAFMAGLDPSENTSEIFQVDAETGIVTFRNPPDFETPVDANGDNTYDIEVTAFFVDKNGDFILDADGNPTVCEVKPLEVCVEDDCIKILENTSPVIADLDCGEGENPDAGLDICVLTDSESNQFGEKTEKPSSYTLSLGELSDQVVTSATGDAAEKVNDKVEIEAYNPGADDGNGSFYVIVSDESDPSKAASDAFFAGTVEQGDNFTASGDFGSETYVHIFASQGGALVSSINFHTSCSSPLIIGDQYGSITLEGATLEGKDSGTFYTVGATETDGDAGVVYEITQNEFDDDGNPVFKVDPDTGEVTFVSPPDFENPFGDNPENKYDIEVTAFFVDKDGNKILDAAGNPTVCEVKPLEVCVEDDCIKILENTSPVIADLDCGEGENPDAGLDICVLTDSESNQFGEKTEKPSSYTLSLGELSDQVVTSATGDAADKVNDKVQIEAYNPGADDGDGSFFVIVSDESDPSKAASDAFFAGTVEQGDNFTASGDFGSETYVHIFASQGGALVSSINFHTSCSSPLIIGDQYGSITLEGATLEGKDSGTFYTVGATETDGDAGVVYYITGGDGFEAGDMADPSDNVSTIFEVDPETGEVTFINPPDFENPLGANGNNYNVQVTAYFVNEDGSLGEVCEVKDLEVCVDDQDCIEIFENTTGPVIDLNLTVDCAVEVPGGDLGLDACEVRDQNGYDKPAALTFTLGDGLSNVINSRQEDGKVKITSTGATDDDGTFFIRVSRDNDPNKTDKLYFSGDVGFGQSFTALTSTLGEDFGGSTYLHIFDESGGQRLQTIEFHTSCSQPIAIGDQFGSIALTGFGFEENGQLIEFGGSTTAIETLGEGEIVYSIVGGEDADLFEVDPETGEVSFIDPPDFEASSADGDDNYEVIVRAAAKDDPDCFTDKPLEICVKDVPELGSITGRYFCDENRDDRDDNGTAPSSFGNVNGTEEAIEGVEVQLFTAAGAFVASTTTDANGEYFFGDLEAGSYRVVFPEEAGKTFVDPNEGLDDERDSDVVTGPTGEGSTAVINLAVGEDKKDVDAGVEKLLGSITGRYFCDENRDDRDDERTGPSSFGNVNGAETAVEGVFVTLVDGAGNVVETETTDENGEYFFGDLEAGDYRVIFPGEAGKTFVKPNVGPGDTRDSDVENVDTMGRGSTATITLAPGENKKDVDAGVEKVNTPPVVTPDEGKGCADELITIDLSDNYSDEDSASVAITMLGGLNILSGETILLDGTAMLAGGGSFDFTGLEVMRSGDEFIFDGEDAFELLDIGEEATATFEFKVEDSGGAVSTANIDVTFCGDANSVASLGVSLPDGEFSLQTLDETFPNGTFTGGEELPNDLTLPVTPNHEEWTIKISGSGDARFDGMIFDEGYCLELNTPALAGPGRGQTDIDFAPVETVTMSLLNGSFDFGGDKAPGLTNQQVANAINWILNQDFNSDPTFDGSFTDGGLDQPDVTDAEIQAAIWKLTDNDLFLPGGRPDLGQKSDAETVFNLALANADETVGVGDKIGILLEPVGPGQPFVFAIDFEQFDCLC